MENFNFLKEEIKQIPPEVLLSSGVISRANDGKSFVCPFCGNGKGDEGDGLTPEFINGIYVWHCFRCDAKFDNIKLLADYYGLDNNREFIKILQRAADDFGISSFSSDVMTSYVQKKSTAPNPPPTQPNDELKKRNFNLSATILKLLGLI
jgi:hypothetical protein